MRLGALVFLTTKPTGKLSAMKKNIPKAGIDPVSRVGMPLFQKQLCVFGTIKPVSNTTTSLPTLHKQKNKIGAMSHLQLFIRQINK